MLSRWKSKDKSEKTSKSSSSSGKKKRKGRDNEDWHGDGRMDGGCSDGETGRGPVRGRSTRRDDPRRHTLAGNQLLQQTHHNSGHVASQPCPSIAMNTPEYATVYKLRDQTPGKIMNKKTAAGRYGQPTNNLLFDEDPGIMSEVDTASTGFRRGGKQRSSLPVVRTPSKTLERPLAKDSTSSEPALVSATDDTLSNVSTAGQFSESLSTYDSHPARKAKLARSLALRTYSF